MSIWLIIEGTGTCPSDSQERAIRAYAIRAAAEDDKATLEGIARRMHFPRPDYEIIEVALTSVPVEVDRLRRIVVEQMQQPVNPKSIDA